MGLMTDLRCNNSRQPMSGVGSYASRSAEAATPPRYCEVTYADDPHGRV
jgi:hypothetical protein